MQGLIVLIVHFSALNRAKIGEILPILPQISHLKNFVTLMLKNSSPCSPFGAIKFPEHIVQWTYDLEHL